MSFRAGLWGMGIGSLAAFACLDALKVELINYKQHLRAFAADHSAAAAPATRCFHPPDACPLQFFALRDGCGSRNSVSNSSSSKSALDSSVVPTDSLIESSKPACCGSTSHRFACASPAGAARTVPGVTNGTSTAVRRRNRWLLLLPVFNKNAGAAAVRLWDEALVAVYAGLVLRD